MDHPNPKLSIHIQPSCAEHRYIRNKDLSTIVERPERLKALAVGIAAAVARTEATIGALPPTTVNATLTVQDDLASAADKLSLQNNGTAPEYSPVARIIRYSVPADTSFLNNPAVRMIHALEEDTASSSGVEYLSHLSRWVLESEDRIKSDGSEIPRGEGLSQGDLYLCPRTLHAIAGALKTTCDAVDSVVQSSSLLAFAAIRPPGHHCGSDEPAGFCWVNNVLVGAAHVYQTHEINRVIIFDIDLHHGNGTQSIAWKINAETYRTRLEAAARREAGILDEKGAEGLQIYYGSLHDILSYPCEDGDPTLTAAASVSLHGNAHGQHIENVHLQEWKDESDFFSRLYGSASATTGDGYATRLFGRARDFLQGTRATPEKTLIFVSCGFDAGEHEYESMSRHNRRVPTTFYHRFACDAREFAQSFAQGRVVGVLEGGYSDRTLVSGGMAWVSGMLGQDALDWWSVKNLEKIESATLKKPRKPRSSAPTSTASSSPPEPWITRTLDLLPTIDATFGVVHTPAPRTRKKVEPPPPGNRMTLRDRGSKPKPNSEAEKPQSRSTKPKSTLGSPAKGSRAGSSGKRSATGSPEIVPPPLPPVPLMLSTAPSMTVSDLRLEQSTSTLPTNSTTDVDNIDPELEEAVKALEGISLNQEVNSNPGAPPDPAKASLVIKLKRPPKSSNE